MYARTLILLMIFSGVFLTPEIGVTAEDYVLDTFGENIEEKDLAIQLSSHQYPGSGVHLRSWDIRCTRWPVYDEHGSFVRYDYYLGALVEDYNHEFLSVDLNWPEGTETMVYELYRLNEWNSGRVLISSDLPPEFPLYCTILLEIPSGQTDIFYGTVNSFGDLDQEPRVDLTSPPYNGSFRVQEHDFGEQVVLKSISIDAGESWVVVGDMEIEIKLYGKETESSEWYEIGVYTFGPETKEIAIDEGITVIMVKYGLWGTEGIKLSAPISDPTPDLYSVTLSTYEPIQLFVVIPGINDEGEEMIEVAHHLTPSECRVVEIPELWNLSDEDVRNIIESSSRLAMTEGKDLIVNIDMDLGEGNYWWQYGVPKEFHGQWNKATKWAGHKANVVSEAFKQVVPEGRRVLFAHSAGGDATNQSLRDSRRKKMYDDINILNGRTGAKGLSRALQRCGYQGSEVKIFTSQRDYPSNPPIFLGGSISNKDAAKKFARAGSWIHLHCNALLIGLEWQFPRHSGLRNNPNNPAKFEVYTQAINGAPYESTFISVMSADWTSLILETADKQTVSSAEQSRPKSLDTHTHLLPITLSPDMRDNSPSQEEVKTPEGKSGEAVAIGERIDTTPLVLLEAQEAVGFMLFETDFIISELGLENFNSEESAIGLTNTIDAIFVMLDEGLYFEALVVLDNDVLQRTDGCANTDQPDEDDWIKSFEGQVLLYPLIIETIGLLENLM